MIKKIILCCTIAFTLAACAPKKDQVVAIKIDDEYVPVNQGVSRALTNKDKDEKVICRKENISGSRFKHIVCTTKSQRLQQQNDVRRTIEGAGNINSRFRTTYGGG